MITLLLLLSERRVLKVNQLDSRLQRSDRFSWSGLERSYDLTDERCGSARESSLWQRPAAGVRSNSCGDQVSPVGLARWF